MRAAAAFAVAAAAPRAALGRSVQIPPRNCYSEPGGAQSGTPATASFAAASGGRRQEVLTAYFDPQRGLGYNLGRVPIGSCDFSLYSWTCGDLKEGRDVWARHFVRFVEAMGSAGIPLWGVSVQNEPEAAQCWEIQRLSTRLKSAEAAETATEGAVDVAWLLHNGKIRRRIGAVVRFHPIPELFVQTSKVEVSENAEDPGEDDAMPQRGASSSCPLSDHARTYAGYLLQFLRDRHELFELCPAHGGDRPVCIYGDAFCSCRMRVSILPEGWKMLNSLADDEDLEALIQLVAQKVSQLSAACGSQKVPLVRLGRDADVKKALRGRALLSLLDADARRQAAAGQGPRLRLETSSATFLIALQAGAFELEEAAPALPTANRNRRMAPPPSICLLGEAPGLAVLRKPPKVTTEALLEALQSHYDQQSVARQVISVSRLDRDTSGVLVAATSTEGADCLTEQFKADW
ncbi:hypothetical protein AK812_SmicGene17860 [Symbiodinium microadriaticum]|uniref:Pseudouridine synthase RsuA/RluA-like domain-containing protein n=1 Tax=Symbiodinium microadriaticum TaxID=2951 RepID=A0A1Q9DWL3_SYMMI|nr:hypothetical protein AK812_SmicGene17860 [Symbiodinium microadriaticum]